MYHYNGCIPLFGRQQHFSPGCLLGSLPVTHQHMALSTAGFKYMCYHHAIVIAAVNANMYRNVFSSPRSLRFIFLSVTLCGYTGACEHTCMWLWCVTTHRQYGRYNHRSTLRSTVAVPLLYLLIRAPSPLLAALIKPHMMNMHHSHEPLHVITDQVVAAYRFLFRVLSASPVLAGAAVAALSI